MQDHPLKTIILNEIEHLDELSDVIVEERTALEKNRMERLATITLQKQQLFAELESLASDHFQLIIDAGFEPNLEGISQFIESINEKDELHQLFSTLQEKLILCQQENLVNGNIISIQMRHADNLVQLLYGESDQRTYDENGILR